jgi:hypothetical protein
MALELVVEAWDPDEFMEPLPTSGVIPARSQAVGFAPPGVIRFEWDDYKTLIVISPGGKAKRSTAWVVTYDSEGKVAVAYRAMAFKDAAGLVHIDARRAIITGPMAEEWSPDSFAVAPDGIIYAIDDMNRANTGKVSERHAAGTPTYQKALALAIATVRESS